MKYESQRSPSCHHPCFSNAAVCLWCGETFESGALEQVAIAGEKAFKRKGHAIFLSVLLGSLAVLALFPTSQLKRMGMHCRPEEQTGEA